jgi:hypothetical protein
MNYLLEIISFEQWLETNPLPKDAQLLWYRMMYLDNKAGWSEWVSVDNLRLMGMVGVKREATFIELREILRNAGLIEYIKGKKGQPGRYKMIPVSTKLTFKNVSQNEVQSVVNTVVKSVVQTEAKTSDIYKPKRKPKQKDNESNKESKGTTAFTPPTLSEVIEYCKERNNNVDPQQWHDYYTSNGWKVGKNPMKDWQATVRNWERRDGFKPQPVPPPSQPALPQKSVADNYDPFYDQLMEEARSRGNTG